MGIVCCTYAHQYVYVIHCNTVSRSKNLETMEEYGDRGIMQGKNQTDGY